MQQILQKLSMTMRKLPIPLTKHVLLSRIDDAEGGYGSRGTKKEGKSTEKPIEELEEEGLEEEEELMRESTEERKEQDQECSQGNPKIVQGSHGSLDTEKKKKKLSLSLCFLCLTYLLCFFSLTLFSLLSFFRFKYKESIMYVGLLGFL